jgi:hypothetical protein
MRITQYNASVTTSKKIKFRPIFPIVDVNHEWSMHFQDTWARRLPWAKFIENATNDVH